MGVDNLRELVQAELDGQSWFSTWRKTPSQTTGSGIWFDLMMSPGNPVPMYYAAAPNTALGIARSTDGGIDHGQPVAPATKYLKEFMIMSATATAVPLPFIICDYLMFYPFVDMSITDPQPMTTNITLPRYPTGKGVQIMAVEVAAQSGAGNPMFQVGYTNSNGVSGRITQPVCCNTQVVNGTLINSQPTTPAGFRTAIGPFLPLQLGDVGVRSIDSVTFLTPDIGLITFVLVYPLENSQAREILSPVERVTVVDFLDLPIIQDDAFIGLICMPNGTLSAAPLHGSILTVWN